MGFEPSSRERVFTLGEYLGIVKSGIFTPVEFDEERFRKVIFDMLKYTPNAVKADVVLQKAMVEYCKNPVIAKRFKGKTNSESLFYLKWRQYILSLEEFKIENPIAVKKYYERIEVIGKAKRINNIINSWHINSIIRRM